MHSLRSLHAELVLHLFYFVLEKSKMVHVELISL